MIRYCSNCKHEVGIGEPIPEVCKICVSSSDVDKDGKRGHFPSNWDAKDEKVAEAVAETDGDKRVNHPSHYNQGKYECIDVMVETFGKEAVQNFCLLNAFKYIWRTNEKNGMEDVKKATWYLNKLVDLEEKK